MFAHLALEVQHAAFKHEVQHPVQTWKQTQKKRNSSFPLSLPKDGIARVRSEYLNIFRQRKWEGTFDLFYYYRSYTLCTRWSSWGSASEVHVRVRSCLRARVCLRTRSLRVYKTRKHGSVRRSWEHCLHVIFSHNEFALPALFSHIRHLLFAWFSLTILLP